MSARTSTWGGTEADVTGSAPSGRGERRVRRRLPDGAGNQRRRPARRARRARRTAAEAASTASEAARTLLRDGLSPYGADSLWLWQWVDHGCLRLAGYAGIGAAEAAAWQWILRGAPGPFRAVLAEGTPVCSRRDRPPPGRSCRDPRRRRHAHCCRSSAAASRSVVRWSVGRAPRPSTERCGGPSPASWTWGARLWTPPTRCGPPSPRPYSSTSSTPSPIRRRCCASRLHQGADRRPSERRGGRRAGEPAAGGGRPFSSGSFRWSTSSSPGWCGGADCRAWPPSRTI